MPPDTTYSLPWKCTVCSVLYVADVVDSFSKELSIVLYKIFQCVKEVLRIHC